ncbi:hypothetical protein [Adhaeribacter soli]|uniref:Uncharacterized protein n=1 Tax=Adhaeribacter soli TaxID=2607655 RepID=A0A5N1JA36_9BACT|nr:hypothetical protein [Adhaeribacter soli]KAA9345699.1 hypothetical protein F0P94_01025 [Adhaeribacter soli]
MKMPVCPMKNAAGFSGEPIRFIRERCFRMNLGAIVVVRTTLVETGIPLTEVNGNGFKITRFTFHTCGMAGNYKKQR